MADAYRSSAPEIPCKKHPEVAASTSCTRCGALLCDACRAFVDGTQICIGCKPRSRFAPGVFAWTFAGVAALVLLFVALTEKPLANMSSPSPVTDVPALASMSSGSELPSEISRCVGEHCFYSLRVLY
jgi:hypothetical protein